MGIISLCTDAILCVASPLARICGSREPGCGIWASHIPFSEFGISGASTALCGLCWGRTGPALAGVGMFLSFESLRESRKGLGYTRPLPSP